MLEDDNKSASDLAFVGAEIVNLFRRPLELSETWIVDPKYSAAAWRNESQRFDLWADNLGLHHHGHSSLQYRLRESTILESLVTGLLNDLRKSLHDLVKLNQIGGELEEQESQSDDELAGDSPEEAELDEALDDYEEDSEFGTIFNTITDIIDRLYKLATQIRNPKMRLATSKALTFKMVDEDTGIDLIQEFVQTDTRHIEELFWDHRKVDVKDPGRIPEERRDNERRPRELIEADNTIIARLVRANTRRRQQFGYWRRHRSKNAQETTRILKTRDRLVERSYGLTLLPQGKPAISEHTKTFSRPTTATYLHTPAEINISDDASTMSVRTVVPNARNIQDEQVDVPHPPESLKGTKHFQCPYCFTLCARSTLKGEAWREHIFRDLRPYVCTYLDCESADQVYDSYKDWASHELSSHCSTWRCTIHPELNFSRKSSLEDHWLQTHGESEIPLDLKYATWATQTISTTLDRSCPICLYKAETLEAIQNHIATHLQRIALFALPRSTDLEDASAEGKGSSRDANAEISDSSQLDLESLTSENDSNTSRLTGESSPPLTIELVKKINDTTEPAAMEERTSEFIQNLHSETLSKEDVRRKHAEVKEMAGQIYELKGEEHDLDHFETLNRMRNSRIEFNRQGKYIEAESVSRDMVKLNERKFGLEHPETLKSMRDMRDTLIAQNNHDEAANLARGIVEICQRKFGSAHHETIESMENLMEIVLYNQNQYEEAETICRQILGLNQLERMRHLLVPLIALGKMDDAEVIASRILRLYGNHADLKYFTLSNNIEVLLRKLTGKDHHAEAEQIGRRALNLREKILGKEHFDTLNSMFDFMLMLMAQGKYNEAEDIGRELMNLQKERLGKQHLATLKTMHQLMSVLMNLNKFVEAEEMGWKLLDLQKENLSEQHPITLDTMHQLMSVLMNQNKLVEAEDIGRKLLDLRKKISGEKNYDTLKSMRDLIEIMIRREDFSEAEKLGFQLLILQNSSLGVEHPDTLENMDDLAMILMKQRKFSEAEDIARTVVRTKQEILGPDHPSLLLSINTLSETYERQEKHAEEIFEPR